MEALLRERKGVALKADWAAAAVEFLRETSEEAVQSREAMLEAVWEQFLHSDQAVSGAAVLPDVDRMHDEVLRGKYVLQIAEMKNIGEALEKRGEETQNRCVRLVLTDGTTRVEAFEYQRLPHIKMEDLKVGVKVAVRDVLVRRGMLFLTSPNLTVLGGSLMAAEENENNTGEAEGNQIS